ncbi:hypothetical protein [Riemerella columbipharyngis]|nr:hypothetical protein [Riemerella columbipharyngis]
MMKQSFPNIREWFMTGGEIGDLTENTFLGFKQTLRTQQYGGG